MKRFVRIVSSFPIHDLRVIKSHTQYPSLSTADERRWVKAYLGGDMLFQFTVVNRTNQNDTMKEGKNRRISVESPMSQRSKCNHDIRSVCPLVQSRLKQPRVSRWAIE